MTLSLQFSQNFTYSQIIISFNQFAELIESRMPAEEAIIRTQLAVNKEFPK